uniref:CopG family transcriptional regulator n=1 Tax=Ignisphaera aggregans TaxID=334771 RepID=A0A7J3Z791_9CREN
MGGYVTVSVKVRRNVVERARALGIDISELVRRVLEEEVSRRELELIRKRLDELRDALSALDVDRVVKHIREDRKGR